MYRQFLDGIAEEYRRKKCREAFKEEWRPIRYGWCLGSEEFKDKLTAKIERVIVGRDRQSYSGEGIERHDEAQAERLARGGMAALGVDESDLLIMRKGDDRKCVIAWLVHTRTMVRHKWIADRLIVRTH